jgi:allophanate hydrolase
MTISVLKPGLQSTLQSRPRIGLRHQGVPANGAADPLSLALANKLVGNAWDAPAVEAALLGPKLRFDNNHAFALTGATAVATLNGSAIAQHETVFAKAGDELAIGATEVGSRVYLAIAGGFIADEILGSSSTNLQAAFGGACETALLNASSLAALFETNWIIDRRADRMGLRLEGPRLAVASEGRMPSAGVIPGTIQCPEDGAPYVLSVDAGTVGGYPRVAQVARVDRHVLGQLRPGDHVRLLRREPDEAARELRGKINYWREWLPQIGSILR